MAVKVKICGLTNQEDARAALEAGAGLLGFIFYQKSPRSVSVQDAKTIISFLRTGPNPFMAVGVFVNETAQHIAHIMDTCGLDLAQLHGEETPETLSHSVLHGRAYKALRPQNREQADQLIEQFIPFISPCSGEDMPAFLIDAYHPQLRGGSGSTADWGMVKPLASRYPVLLAGGLTADNVQQALGCARPWGVDAASGVESSPGKKDHQKMIDFIYNVRQYDEEVL